MVLWCSDQQRSASRAGPDIDIDAPDIDIDIDPTAERPDQLGSFRAGLDQADPETG